jgi:hypothetical protein
MENLKNFLQSSRTQSYHTEIGSFSIYQQYTDWERNQGNNPIYSSLKNNKMPWNKFNERNKRYFYLFIFKKIFFNYSYVHTMLGSFLMKTINHWREQLKKTLEDRKTFHACGSFESTLWKWSYYQKQATCSNHSPSKFQWHSAQK